MPTHARQFVSILLATLLASPMTFAFQSPLSEESIREAYFLGQRHDGSLERLLDKYTKHLPPPKQGPHIASITFLTPFMQVAKSSDKYIGSYSAQQAALDHRNSQETVEISVEILFTESYGAIIAQPTTNSGSAQGYQLRSQDFWKDFQAEVLQGDEIVKPSNFTGEPNLVCPYRRGTTCTLIGATLYLEFPATALNSDSATIHIIPPEGPEVWLDFDLTTLR